MHSRGGFRYLVWGGDLKRQIEIELSGQIPDAAGKERSIAYRVEIAGGPTHYALAREIFLLRTDGEERKLLEFPNEQGMASLWDENGKEKGGVGKGAQQLYLSECKDPTRYPLLGAFSQAMSSWAFYNFVPSRMALPQPARKDLRLQKEGENISSVLHTFQSEYSQSFIEVEELLKSGVPEVERLLTPLTEESQTYLAFEERSVPLRIPSWACPMGRCASSVS